MEWTLFMVLAVVMQGFRPRYNAESYPFVFWHTASILRFAESTAMTR